MIYHITLVQYCSIYRNLALILFTQEQMVAGKHNIGNLTLNNLREQNVSYEQPYQQWFLQLNNLIAL